jgi:hypothetical protein
MRFGARLLKVIGRADDREAQHHQKTRGTSSMSFERTRLIERDEPVVLRFPFEEKSWKAAGRNDVPYPEMSLNVSFAGVQTRPE